MQHGRALHGLVVRDVDGLAVPVRATAAPRREKLVGHRIEHHAGRDLTLLLERDEHGPDWDPSHEILRPVDRIDDPPRRLRTALAESLPEDPPARNRAPENLRDALPALPVGWRARGLVGLQADVDPAVVVLKRDSAGGARSFDGGGEDRMVGRRAHASHSPRSSRTCLNTSSASTTTGIPPYVTCWKITSATSCHLPPTLITTSTCASITF